MCNSCLVDVSAIRFVIWLMRTFIPMGTTNDFGRGTSVGGST